jgi:hypothetical protein
MQFLSFSDTVQGACLETFLMEFKGSAESGVTTSFDPSSQKLVLFSERTDLTEIQTLLSVRRGNGDLLQTATF